MEEINNTSELDTSYNNKYSKWKGWVNLFEPNDNDLAYFRGEFSDFPLDGARVLEVGFGAGSFIAYSKQAGANISGCELIEELCLAGLDRGYDTRFGDINIFSDEAGSFDLIVALDVMEHIPTKDLVDFMCAIRNLLKPGGVFLARVPNGGSPWGLINQYGDITHVSVLTPGRFQQLSEYSKMNFVSCQNAYKVINKTSKTKDIIRFHIRDIVNSFLDSVFKLGNLPLDANIVARFCRPRTDLLDEADSSKMVKK